MRSITPSEKQKLKRIANGKNPLGKSRLNMDERVAFLNDFKKYSVSICEAVKNHIQPTSSNVESKTIESWESIQTVGVKLEVINSIKIASGKDGNHHKIGRYFHKVVNPYHDIAIALTQISPDFEPAFKNPQLHIESPFRLKSNPQELLEQFESLLFKDYKRAYNKLSDYKPK